MSWSDYLLIAYRNCIDLKIKHRLYVSHMVAVYIEDNL